MEISSHNKGFVVGRDRDQEQTSLTLRVLGVEGETVGAVVAAGRLHVLAGVVAVAGRDLLVYRLTFGGGLEEEGGQVNLQHRY